MGKRAAVSLVRQNATPSQNLIAMEWRLVETGAL
jgi:hypothetical protein